MLVTWKGFAAAVLNNGVNLANVEYGEGGRFIPVILDEVPSSSPRLGRLRSSSGSSGLHRQSRMSSFVSDNLLFLFIFTYSYLYVGTCMHVFLFPTHSIVNLPSGQPAARWRRRRVIRLSNPDLSSLSKWKVRSPSSSINERTWRKQRMNYVSTLHIPRSSFGPSANDAGSVSWLGRSTSTKIY